MSGREQRRRLLRQLRDTAFGVDGGRPGLPLEMGPPGRWYYRGWPEYEAQMLAEWNRYRDAVMASCVPGPRPWAFFWFDVPHAETIPGETRDRNLSAGRLTAAEVEMMARAHAQYAMARIAESRAGQTVADWLADPALIAKSAALVGWNSLSADVIAYLRSEGRWQETSP